MSNTAMTTSKRAAAESALRPRGDFPSPNGLRLSGARKGVRCSRGLGRVANIELTTTLSSPQTVKLDDAENRSYAEAKQRQDSDDNTPISSPPLPILYSLSCHPSS